MPTEAVLARPNVALTKRGEKTRKQILETTRRLLAQPGFRNVTLDQIAEETGTAKSSILWHFGTKNDLMLQVLDNIVHDLERRYRQSYGGSFPLPKKIRLMFKEYTHLIEHYPELGTVFFRLIFDAELISSIRNKAREMYRDHRQMVVRHLSSGAFPVSEEMAAGVVALLDGIFIQWHIDPNRVDLQKVFESIATTLEAIGSCTSTHRKGSQRRKSTSP